MVGVKFGTKHSYNDFGLVLKRKTISLPKSKRITVEIPGRDGVVDITNSVYSEPKFENRKLQFEFTVIEPISHFTTVLSILTNYLHGKTMQVIMDADKNYYYEGYCTINSFKTNKRLATIVVDCDCGPYKWDVRSSMQNWEWDTLNFVDSIIYPNTVVVSGTSTINLPSKRKSTTPTFICSSTMNCLFKGKSYSLNVGANVVPIKLEEGDNAITFNGNGTVQIDYKGGSL